MNSSAEVDPMADLNDLDDLGNLFEFGDIDLNTIADPGQYGEHIPQQHGTHPSTSFADMDGTPPIAGTMTHDFPGHEQYGMSQNIDQQHFVNQPKSHAPSSASYTSDSVYQPSVQQAHNPYSQSFQYQSQANFLGHHHVPPTPNSYEMHGETGRFMQSHSQLDPQQRAILEQRYQVRKDDAIAFTPMVSPAGTPQYSMLPDFTTPGAYFSPLTSPMLLAQNQQPTQFLQQQQDLYRPHASTAPNSNTISPIDANFDIDMLDGMNLPESTGPKPRRSRRKPATPKTTSTHGRPKQSPAQTAQKRKSLSLSAPLPGTGSENVLQRSVTSQPSSSSFQLPPHLESSEGDSISPEALSEIIMGPPPRPASSLNPSPVISGQQQQSTSASSAGPAATPKSLLTTRGVTQSINGQQVLAHTSTQPWIGPGALDDLSLPEAAAEQIRRKPSLSQIDTSLVSAQIDGATPRTSTRKTPKLGPLSTPASVRPGSAVGSPIITASPTTASTPSAILSEQKGGKGGRGSKKRGSTSTNGSKLVSPALMPRISPSIKPLLPEGTTLNTATQAMLLASKSNYQNILEGNHLPGVTYPDSLSTGLSSKRTSHKVAEQGRRNRINEALKEMQALIPKASNAKSPGGEADGDSAEFGDEDKFADSNSKEESATRSNNSKAATVELANEYIKKMQKEYAAQNEDLVQLKFENDALKKRLDRQSTSPADSAGDTAASASGSSQ